MSDNSSQKFLSLSSASYSGPVFGPQETSEMAEESEDEVFESPEEIARALSAVESESDSENAPEDELDYGNVKKLIEQLSGEPVDDDELVPAENASESGAESVNSDAEKTEKPSDYLWSDDENSEHDAVVSAAVESDPRDTEADKKVRTESFKIMANVGNFGLFLVVALIFTYVIGGWLDGLFGTKPVFRVFWMVVGVVASFRELYMNIKAAQKLAESKDDK